MIQTKIFKKSFLVMLIILWGKISLKDIYRKLFLAQWVYEVPNNFISLTVVGMWFIGKLPLPQCSRNDSSSQGWAYEHITEEWPVSLAILIGLEMVV